MKQCNILLFIIAFYATPFTCNAKQMPQQKSTIATVKPTTTITPSTHKSQSQKTIVSQQTLQQKPIAQSPSYAQALNIIKTMRPDMILKNNLFTPEFLNFIKSLNLSDVENTALLQAGVNRHAIWTDNNATNKQMALHFKNSIQSAAQSLKAIPQQKPQTPKKQIPAPTQKQPQTRTTKQPQQQPKPTVVTPVPVTKAQPIKPLEQPTGPVLKSGNFPTNNVIMILDPKTEETLERRVGAMVEVGIRALYEQAAPIIMTSNVLEIIAQIIQRIGTDNFQKLKNAPYNQIQQFAMQLLQAYNLPTVNSLDIMLLSLISFDTNNFNCYLHTSANIVLLIPKKYLTANLANAANLNGKAQAQACGFDTSSMTMVNDVTSPLFIQQLQKQQSTFIDEETFINKLTSLFIPQKRNGQLISPEQDTKWVIYIVGHGHPAHETIGTVREQLNINKKNLTMLKNPNVKIQGASPAAMKARAEAYIKKYEPIVEERSDWPASQLVPETAAIAGLEADQFSRLITFFNNSLNMGYLHYISCFAGGYNQTFVNEVLSSLDAHFIVSAEGIHEGETRTTGINLAFSSIKPHLRVNKHPFTDFFKLLRLFISQPEEFVRIKEKQKEPVAQILRAIVPGMQESNQPFVRFPGAGVFGALALDKGTKKLTKVIVKAHEIENNPIDVSDPTINMVIVVPSRVNIPLLFKKNVHCSIVSPTPTTLEAGHETINVFKEINFEGRLQEFLYDIIHLNARAHTQTFVINTLTNILYNQSGLPIKQGSTNTINNLIIQMKGVPGRKQGFTGKPSAQLSLLSPADIQYSRIGINVQIIFELNGILYQCTLGIKDFDTELSKIFQQISFISQPIQAANMNTIANQFLTAEEIKKVQKPITLESIAEFIDSKIDIQQPFLPESSEEANKALLEFTEREPKKLK